jgi:hypothetical protein
MRIIKRAGQSGDNPGGYVASRCQKLREGIPKDDCALAGSRRTSDPESGSGVCTALDLQQRQIVILLKRDDLSDAGLPATSFNSDICAIVHDMRIREQVPGLGDEKTRSS